MTGNDGVGYLRVASLGSLEIVWVVLMHGGDGCDKVMEMPGAVVTTPFAALVDELNPVVSLIGLDEDETRLTEVTVAPGFLEGKPTFNVDFNVARRLEPTSFGHGDVRCWGYANDALMLVKRLGSGGCDEWSSRFCTYLMIVWPARRMHFDEKRLVSTLGNGSQH
ncbi:hypothetical protein ACLB2K_060213 [Fragaria x ananassa]